MKAKILSFLCICFIVLPCIFLSGCDIDYKKYEGNYFLTLVTYANGETKTIDNLIEDNSVQNKEQEVINLTRDQLVTFNGLIGGNSGTYEISEDAIILKFDNNTIIGSIVSNTITLNIIGITYVYERSK